MQAGTHTHTQKLGNVIVAWTHWDYTHRFMQTCMYIHGYSQRHTCTQGRQQGGKLGHFALGPTLLIRGPIFTSQLVSYQSCSKIISQHKYN